MSDVNLDDLNHAVYMRKTFELAREASDRGDLPFGSLIVYDGSIIMTASNRERTSDDIRRHPELHLAYRACNELDHDTRRETVMYTSTEPCPMCAGGMATASFGYVIYIVGSDELVDFTGTDPPVRSRDILSEISKVVGPILNREGREVHRDFDW
jgi:tRNA(Arg) A34 adenosine deaminase TadA